MGTPVIGPNGLLYALTSEGLTGFGVAAIYLGVEPERTWAQDWTYSNASP